LLLNKLVILIFALYMIGDTIRIIDHKDRFVILNVFNTNTDSCYVVLGNLEHKLIRYERCYKLRKTLDKY
jgi:hypothetical protein